MLFGHLTKNFLWERRCEKKFLETRFPGLDTVSTSSDAKWLHFRFWKNKRNCSICSNCPPEQQTMFPKWIKTNHGQVEYIRLTDMDDLAGQCLLFRSSIRLVIVINLNEAILRIYVTYQIIKFISKFTSITYWPLKIIK